MIEINVILFWVLLFLSFGIGYILNHFINHKNNKEMNFLEKLRDLRNQLIDFLPELSAQKAQFDAELQPAREDVATKQAAFDSLQAKYNDAINAVNNEFSGLIQVAQNDLFVAQNILAQKSGKLIDATEAERETAEDIAPFNALIARIEQE